MMASLRLSVTPTTRVAALLIARHRRTGMLVKRFVTCTVPDDLFAKAALAVGRGTEHWITVHPNGEGTKGTPVLIRESKSEPGTWHVIAGAGGHLNYLRLSGVATPEEARERERVRKEAKKAKAKHQQEFERDRKANMTEDERKIEAAHERQKHEAAQKAALELHARQQEFVADVAKAVGWKDEEWQFAETAQRLRASGTASPERIQKLEEAHHKTVYCKALDVVQQSRRQILADQDRARVILGDTPLTTDDPNTVALSDLLDKPAMPSGKGFQSITKTSSDEEIRAALVASDKVRLREELEAARADLVAARNGDVDGAVPPDLAAHVAELKGDLHTAELLELATTMTPEQIEARRAELAATYAAVRKEQADYVPRLTSLRGSLRGEGAGLTSQARAELDTLESRAVTDQQRVEHLRGQSLDMAVVAGETVKPAIAGEQKRISARRQMDREAEIREEHGEEGVANYRAMLAKLREGGERYRTEIRHYKETGALAKVEVTGKPIVDAEKALDLLARTKALKKLERDIHRGEETGDFDGKMYGKGYFTETGQATPAMRDAAQRDLKNAVLEQKTRAFLERAESPELLLGRGGVFTEDYDQRALHRALERHLSAGAYNALNNAALAATKSPVLSREVVDTLGAAGAAQLLAHVIAEHETPATLREMAKGVGEYHVSANVEQSEERLRESEEALDRADEAMAAVTSPADLAVALEANTQRAAALEEARQTLGQALGEYEATAALATALSEGKRDHIDVNLGPIGTETAVRQMRLLGLARDDYEVTSDGTNYFATIKASGFSKLAQPVDMVHAQLVDDIVAIKKGEQDDPNWQPKGTIVRPRGSLTAPGLEPASLTAQIKPYGNIGDAGNVAGDVQEHIALRAANGDDPNDILADMQSSHMAVPEKHRQAYQDAIARVFPTQSPLVEQGKPIYERTRSGKLIYDRHDHLEHATFTVADHEDAIRAHARAGRGNRLDQETAQYHSRQALRHSDAIERLQGGIDEEDDSRYGPPDSKVLGGKGEPLPRWAPTKADAHVDAVRQLTRDYLKAQGMDRSLDINTQALDANDPTTHEAFTQALAKDPRAMVAFKAIGELADQDQRVLRHFFATDVAKADAKAGFDQAGTDRALAALGSEPTKETKGLFGGAEQTPEWRDWNQRRHAILAQAHDGGDPESPSTTSWPEYVAVMGGTGKAYETLQDRLKSGFLKELHRAYTTLHNQPLRVGTLPIAHAELHGGYLDPATRAAHLEKRRELIDEARTRAVGKYAAGSALEKMERLAREQEIARQNQMGFLGGTTEATKREPKPTERYTLGQYAEGQISSLMRSMSRNWKPGEPVKLLGDKSWSGKYVHQQRAVRALLRSKRMALALGTGCVAAETLLDLADGTRRTFGELWSTGERVVVRAWTGRDFAAVLASPVFVKGYDEMYRVTLDDGQSVVVTAAHRFLAPAGWRRLQSLAVDDLIAASVSDAVSAGTRDQPRDVSPAAPTSRGTPDAAAADAPHSTRITRGSRLDCAADRDLGGARLPLGGDSDRVGAPSRADALEHIHWWPLLDDLAEKSARTLGGRPDGHPSSGCMPTPADSPLGAAGLLALSGGATRWQPQPHTRARVPRSSRLSCTVYRRREVREWNAYCVHFTWRRIVSIEPVGKRLVFDVTVPHVHNYLANGIVHHNSGKTFIGIGAFSHARETPGTGVKRGLWVVPSSIVGQVGGEFARLVKPGAMNWMADPSADRARRLALHGDPETHAVVVSHQAARDDFLHLLASHWGIDEHAAKTRFMGLSRKDAAATTREAWKKAAISYDMVNVDEGHAFLDRDNKPDSLLSRMMQAVTDNAPYVASASADPIKNDHTELRSLLDKLEPSGKYADAGEWNRRYGVNTTAAAEALKREAAPYVYAAQIRSGKEVNRRRETVPLSASQSKQYASALSAFHRLQAARERGEVDVEAARELVPKRFATAPVSEHEAIARQIQRNPGTLKEQALARIVDMTPREHNAKMQKLVEILKDHPAKEKPVVVFAHNLKAVHDITEGLAEAGHRVISLTGADSAKERDRKRLMFQPEVGEPKADVFVLSDAGQTGLNLQRGQTLIQYDRPMTSMSHAQRNGRIDRLGQQNAVDLIDLVTDSPYEVRAQKRIDTKYALRDILTDPAELIDDTGLAATFRDARRNAAQGGEEKAA